MKHLCILIIDQPEEKMALGSSSNHLRSSDPKVYVTWNSGRTGEVVRAKSRANPRIWWNWWPFKGIERLWCFPGWLLGPIMKWNQLSLFGFFLWSWSLGVCANTPQPYNNFCSSLSFSFLPPCLPSPFILFYSEYIYFWNPMWAHRSIENMMVWTCIMLKRIKKQPLRFRSWPGTHSSAMLFSCQVWIQNTELGQGYSEIPIKWDKARPFLSTDTHTKITVLHTTQLIL